jgi:hypothetical protein
LSQWVHIQVGKASGVVVALLSLALAGCAQSSVTPVTDDSRQPLHDFSGHWEVDFSASDTVPGQIMAGLKRSRRNMERRSSGVTGSAGGVGVLVGGGSGSSLMAVADMVELVTEPQLLEIRQTEREVQIRRENSFALICDLSGTPPVVTTTVAGRETCVWSGRELRFRLELAEGLRIEHQLLLSADRSTIAFTTGVASSQVRDPLTVRKLFTRYDPSREVYRCSETVTRGRVCTTEAADPS